MKGGGTMSSEIDRLEIQVEMQASKTNQQLDNMISNLGKMSGSLSGIKVGSIGNIGTSANKSNNYLRSLVKTMASYSAAAVKGLYSTKALSSVLSGAYNSAVRLAKGFKSLGRAAEASMDYIETYNYYNVTMSKISSEFSNQWQRYGYESGEAYAESFTSRLNELTQKMSGYTVGSDGVLSISGGQNLSLDPEQIMSYQANVSAITNSVGLVGETSVNASKALSMLAADMSSLKNIDMSTVMNNFQSGLIGQSRALYKYGIDITNATLQTYAYKYGIEAAVSDMTQADKMQLRLLAILDQSKVAWGDQASTINSVANQYRILKQQISNVARVIGNLFIPVLQAVLPVVNGVLIALQRMFVFIGNLIGIDWSGLMDGISTGYGGADDAIGGLIDDTDAVVDETDGIGDSLGDAEKKAKKLQRTLLGFDQINKLNDDTDTSSGSSGSAGSSGGIGSIGGGGIDLSGAIADALAEYESIWDKALKSSQNKAQAYADKICSIFDKMWRMIKSGDFEGLGEYIAGGVDFVFQKINSVFNWGKLGPTITGFVNGYTRTINSLVDNVNWYNIGKSIGDGLNVITSTLYLYLTGIDWVNIGTAIAVGLNGMVNSVDWDILGKTIGAWIMKIPQIAYGFVTNLEWSSLGIGIGTSLNGALAQIDLGMIGATIGTLITRIFSLITNAAATFNWQEFGANIANGINNLFSTFDGQAVASGINAVINGLLTTFTTVIKNVDWSGVATSIGEVLGHLDWGTIAPLFLAVGVAKFATSLSGIFIKSLKDIVGDKIKNWIAETLLPNIAGAFAEGGAIGRIGAKIAEVFKGMLPAISGALSSIGSTISAGFSALVGIIGGPGLIAIGAAIAAIIAVICNWDKVKEFFTVTIPNWWNETVVPWIQSLPEFFRELPGKIWDAIIAVKDKFVEWASGIIETVATEVPRIIEGIVNFFVELPGKIGYAIGFVAGKFVEWAASIWELLSTKTPEIISGVVNFFTELPGKIWEAIITAKDRFVEWAAGIWEFLSIKIPEIISGVIQFFVELPGKIWGAIIGTIQKIGEFAVNLRAKIKEVFPQVIESIINFFVGLPGKFLEFGKNMIQGFIDGISNMLDNIKKALGNFVGGFVKGFKNALGIHSPSTVFQNFGENTMSGYERGLGNKESTVTSKVGNIANTLLGKFNTVDSDYNKKGQAMINGLIAGINNRYGSLNTLMSGMVKKLGAAFGNPTSVFSTKGTQIINGIKAGLTNSWPSVSSWLSGLANKISSAIGNLYNTGRDVMQNFADGMRSVHIPTPSMYISSWDYHNLGDGGSISTPNFAVQWYANGGFPGTGELFFARERGPELIGRMGNKNAVANNDQIVDGIAAGVKTAMTDVMTDIMIAMGGMGSNKNQPPIIELTIQEDSETTYRRIMKGKEKHDRRYTASIQI